VNAPFKVVHLLRHGLLNSAVVRPCGLCDPITRFLTITAVRQPCRGKFINSLANLRSWHDITEVVTQTSWFVRQVLVQWESFFYNYL